MADKKSDSVDAKSTKTPATDEQMAAISQTKGGSPVTSDATGDGNSATQTLDLSKAKIEVPKEAFTAAPEIKPKSLNDLEQADYDRNELSAAQRGMDAGLGLIQTLDGTFAYVGQSVGLDTEAETQNGVKITSANSTFTPLAEIKFDPSVRIKDPKTGEYYFPTEAVSFDACELNGSFLIPRETDAAHRESRLNARLA